MPDESPRKRRHHFLPKFYLHGFTDPDLPSHLWVYEKGGKEPRQISVTDAAVEKDYYAFTKVDGTKDTIAIEDSFAALESKIAPLYRRLVAGEPLAPLDRAYWALFMGLMFTRVPNFRKNAEQSTLISLEDACQTLANDPELIWNDRRQA